MPTRSAKGQAAAQGRARFTLGLGRRMCNRHNRRVQLARSEGTQSHSMNGDLMGRRWRRLGFAPLDDVDTVRKLMSVTTGRIKQSVEHLSNRR